MADAPKILSAHLINEIRSLGARGKVTFPQEDSAYAQVERVVKVPKAHWQLAYDVADTQWPSALLVQQQIVDAGDDHYVEVYRRYTELPGVALATYSLEAGGVLKKTTEQPVVYGTLPTAAGDYELSDRVIAGSAQEATRIIEELVSASGDALGAFPEVDIEEWQERPSVLRVTTRKIVPAGTEPPEPKTAFRTATGRVWESSVSPIPDSHKLMQTVVWSERPVAWVDYPMAGFVFPGIFKYSDAQVMAYDTRFPPPWPGDAIVAGTYKLIGARQTLSKARAVYTYSDGKSDKRYREYSVTSPGVGSRYFNIPNNTIHEAFQFDAYSNEGVFIQRVESFAASSPETYDPRDILVAKSEEREWHGGFYEHVLIQVSEATSAYDFADLYDWRTFKATALDTITQPGKPPVRLQLVSDSAADTGDAIIYGYRGTTYTKERVTLNGTTPVSTTKSFSAITHVRLLDSAAGTITGRGTGAGSSGSLEFLANPSEGNAIGVGIAGSLVNYALTATPAVPGDVLIGATLADTLANLVKAITLTGAEGVDYGTGTLIHDDATAEIAEDQGAEEGDTSELNTLIFSDKVATDYQRSTNWVLTYDGAGTITDFNDGSNGSTFVTITSPAKHAFRAIDFNNPDLLTGNGNEASYNLPAFVNAASDEIVIASPGTAVLRLCATGSPGLICSYQRRATGDPTAWGAAVALPILADGTVHTVILPGTTTRIRLLIANGSSNQARKVHADVGYVVSV